MAGLDENDRDYGGRGEPARRPRELHFHFQRVCEEEEEDPPAEEHEVVEEVPPAKEHGVPWLGIILTIIFLVALVWFLMYVWNHHPSWLGFKDSVTIDREKILNDDDRLELKAKEAAMKEGQTRDERHYVHGPRDSKNRLHGFAWPPHLKFPDLNNEYVTAEGGNIWYTIKRRRRPVEYRAGVTDGNRKISILASSEDGVSYKSDNGKVELSVTPLKEKPSTLTWKKNRTLYGLDFYGDPESDEIYEIGYDAPDFDNKGNQIHMTEEKIPTGFLAVSNLSGEELKKIPEIQAEMNHAK